MFASLAMEALVITQDADSIPKAWEVPLGLPSTLAASPTPTTLSYSSNKTEMVLDSVHGLDSLYELRMPPRKRLSRTGSSSLDPVKICGATGTIKDCIE